VQWNDYIDFNPDTLYLESKPANLYAICAVAGRITNTQINPLASDDE
jgi:hypothetical protein